MRNTRHLLLILFMVALAVSAYLILVKRIGADSHAIPIFDSAPRDVNRNEEVPVEVSGGTPNLRQGIDDGLASRTILGPNETSARILDSAGVGIEDVEVVWRADYGLPGGWRSSWRRSASLIQEREPLWRGVSSTGGLYGPPKLQSGRPVIDVPVVAWLFRPGWLATAFVVDPDSPVDTWPRDIRLETHASVCVIVRDTEGALVSGVDVALAGAVDPKSPEGRNGAARTLPLALQVGQTDAEGFVEFAALPGDIYACASAGGRVAVPYYGQCRHSIELTLLESFQVAGTLSLPATLKGPISPRLVASVRHTGIWKELFTVALDSEGSWGPIAVPLQENAEEYALLLEGSPLVPDRRFFDPPQAGEDLFFELVGVLGENLWFQAVDDRTIGDPEPEILVDSRVQIVEIIDGRSIKTWYGAGEEEVIIVEGLRPGLIWYQLYAPGYAPTSLISVSVPTENARVWWVGLERSGTIRGVVLGDSNAGNEPVQDFQVVVWPVALPQKKTTHVFEGRLDGSFVIDTVPSGEVAVTAMTALRPAPLPTILDVAPSDDHEVELIVPIGGLITGRILDESTKQPIPSARIQLYVQGGSAPVAPWGAPRSVEVDGRFSFRGGVPRENFLNFEADSYSSRYLSAVPDEDGVLDLGDVLLSQPGQLVVHLVGLRDRPDLDPSALNLRLDGASRQSSALSKLNNDSWGTVFETVNSGRITIELRRGESLIAETGIEMTPGSVESVNLAVGGGTNLEVSLVGGSDKVRFEVSSILIECKDSGGQDYIYRASIEDEGPTVFRAVQGSFAGLSVFGGKSATRYAGTTIKLEPGKTIPVEVRLDDRRFRVTVVDSNDRAIPGVHVSIGIAGTGQALFGSTTESNGSCEFFGVPEESLVVCILHSEAGRQSGIEVDGTQDAVTLTLDGTGTIEVIVTDEGDPLGGADVSLQSTGTVSMSLKPSDQDGIARFEKMAPSTLLVTVKGRGLWDYEAEVKSGEGITRINAQVWRTGALDFSVVDGDGRPISEARLQLKHVSTSDTLTGWVEDQRIPVSGAMTDRDGRIQLEALPHGSYRWAIAAPGMSAESGLVDVPIGGVIVQSARLEPSQD